MTALAQVWHVARKDLRECRLFVLAYVALVLVATGDALGLFAAARGLAGMTILLAGTLVVATLVQTDPPARRDAFWHTRPFFPSSVLGAKALLAVVVVLGIPLAGEAAALAQAHLPAAEALRLLLSSAAKYGMWLLLPAVIAALTNDFKTFLLAWLGLFVLTMIVGGWNTFAGPPNAHSLDYQVLYWLQGFSVLCWIGVLIWMYRGHGVRRGRLAFSVVAAVSVLSAFVASLTKPPYATPSPLPKGLVVATSFAINRLGPSRAALVTMHLDSAPAHERLTVESLRLRVEQTDGHIATFNADPSKKIQAVHLPLPGVTWLFDRPDTLPIWLHQMQGTNYDDIRHATLSATIVAQKLRSLHELSLASDAVLSSDGLRMSIDTLSDTPRQIRLHVRVRLTGDDDAIPYGANSFEIFDFALMNETRHEAIALVSNGERHSTGGTIMLPGASRTDFELNIGTPGTFPPDSAWLRGAKLVVARWTSVGSYSLRDAAIRFTGYAGGDQPPPTAPAARAPLLRP